MIGLVDKLAWRSLARRVPGSYAAYVFASRLVAAYENRSVQITANGERWFQQTLASRGISCAVDVGANKGEWAEGILRFAPNCQLVCYEPVAATFAMLEKAVGGKHVTLVNAALSDESGTLEIQTVSGRPELASAHTDYSADGDVETLVLEARKGDAELERLRIDHVDVLKVDAEGHDLAVLQGLTQSLSHGGVDFIQFEYNHATLAAGISLRHFFDLLVPDYVLCRLLPEGLEATGYHFSLDNFGQSNWICVRRAIIDDALVTRFRMRRARGLAGNLLVDHYPEGDAAIAALKR
ncbi:FkbM family methyltransferase [Aurantiacibacter sp. MUD61]|uniref:FkbM family methyltransferase n=1 Tax=Aurantiacibacter sp. MUD61 TaxID=3009083 RepID=UPI0022F141F2|nr:FkbM family methyltransferase [Aurantiacibacter sp. MUD61]